MYGVDESELDDWHYDPLIGERFLLFIEKAFVEFCRPIAESGQAGYFNGHLFALHILEILPGDLRSPHADFNMYELVLDAIHELGIVANLKALGG